MSEEVACIIERCSFIFFTFVCVDARTKVLLGGGLEDDYFYVFF